MFRYLTSYVRCSANYINIATKVSSSRVHPVVSHHMWSQFSVNLWRWIPHVTDVGRIARIPPWVALSSSKVTPFSYSNVPFQCNTTTRCTVICLALQSSWLCKWRERDISQRSMTNWLLQRAELMKTEVGGLLSTAQWHYRHDLDKNVRQELTFKSKKLLTRISSSTSCSSVNCCWWNDK